MTKIARFFYRYLYWLLPLWYGMTLTLTRFRRGRPDVTHYFTTREIVEALNWGKNWRPDPLKGALDVMMDPRKFQQRIDAGDTKFGDCEDHAIYWCTALLQSDLADRVWIGTVWYEAEGSQGKTGGHVVCVYQVEDRRYWCDYGDPVVTVGDWQWAEAVAWKYHAKLRAAGLIEVVLRRRSMAPKFKLGSAVSEVF